MNQSALFAPDGSGGGGYRRTSLVRLAGEIARSMVAIGKISVEGEVHRPNRRANGRLFFTLRERAAQLSVTVPPARLARCRVVAGERVLASGTLSWFNDWGQLLFVADEVSPVGEGAVAAAIAEARRRLAADGIFDRPRKPIPLLPRAIGVVCGTDAAVRADIESVVAVRFPGYPLVFREVTVQGPGAAESITDALRLLDQRPDIEVIILARGGGDAVSLLPFSDLQLCQAVAASTTPVVAAIGHEADRPLVDEVADLRCGTPSLAAAAVVPDLRELSASLDRTLSLCRAALEDRLAAAEQRLSRIDPGVSLRAGVGIAGHRLAMQANLLSVLHPARACDAAGRRLAAGRAHLESLSPRAVLRRGYAIVRLAPTGDIVRQAAQLHPGERLDIELAEGRAAATVTGVEEVGLAG